MAPRYVADHTGKLFRYHRPTGTRVSLSIPPGLAQRLETSGPVVGHITGLVKAAAALADQTCPVGATGDLKASQVTEIRITPQGVVGLLAYTAFYAHMVHNGTAKTPPNPWLLNAALSVLVGGQRPAAAA